uniref:alginate lyase family protein n=1 Tax=Pararhizobium sp. IMCC3301 TaxID=3067904 RepID=UPI0027421AC9|nr:alginate lyase family protein [Pararhizobium sp. IMCC3301]
MRIVALFLIALCVSVPGVSAQSNETVAYVQEALQELGFDPGTADGAWGRRTRTALNAYRATLDLPEQQDISGSSLYNLHRIVAAGQTLPFPGQILEDFAERQAYLQENEAVRSRQCNNRQNLRQVTADWAPVTRFSESDVSFAAGVTAGVTAGLGPGQQDWALALAEGISVTTANCVAGDAGQCEVLWSYIQKWPQADALITTTRKVENSEKFANTAWLANTVLQPLIFATAVVAHISNPALEEQAPVLDWLYDRVNQFYFVSTKNDIVGDMDNTIARNQALAAVLPSMTLGAFLGDVELFERGFPQFEAALLNQRADGSFPTETKRGSMALSYTGLKLSYLFALAEIAKSQDFDLYDVRWPRGQDLHRAITYTLRGWSNWDTHVLKYARANDAAPMTPSSPVATDFAASFGWLPVYMRRFGSHPNVSLMNGLTLDPVVCSPAHISEGRSDAEWCQMAGAPPLTLRAMLLDNTQKISVFNPAMGFNAGCFLARSDELF